MKGIILSTLFIWFKKIFIRFKYNTGKTWRNNLFNFITLNKDKFFFKLKKIFLLVTLHMYLCDCANIHFLNSKKKEQLRIFFLIKETCLSTYLGLFSNARICLIQRIFFLIKEIFFCVYLHSVSRRVIFL